MGRLRQFDVICWRHLLDLYYLKPGLVHIYIFFFKFYYYTSLVLINLCCTVFIEMFLKFFLIYV